MERMLLGITMRAAELSLLSCVRMLISVEWSSVDRPTAHHPTAPSLIQCDEALHSHTHNTLPRASMECMSKKTFVWRVVAEHRTAGWTRPEAQRGRR